MCFTVAQYHKVAQARMRYWNARNNAPEAEPRFVASAFERPSLSVVRIDRHEPVIEMAQWGLVPAWCRTEDEAQRVALNTLNARGETIFDKPSFREAAAHSRCIIPVNGFFEYQHVGKQRVPYFISMEGEPIFSVGGLLSEWESSATGQLLRTFSVVTTEANPLMATIHNSKKRMPLILSREEERLWLDGSPTEASALVRPSDSPHLQAWRVSPFVVRGRVVNQPSSIQPMNEGLLF